LGIKQNLGILQVASLIGCNVLDVLDQVVDLRFASL
jgi:hypothetical protein